MLLRSRVVRNIRPSKDAQRRRSSLRLLVGFGFPRFAIDVALMRIVLGLAGVNTSPLSG